MLKILTEAEFNRQLSSPEAGYLLFGDEDYTKQHALRRLREAVCPDPVAATFNDIRFTALDFTPSKLLDALEPPPMLGERKIISVTGLDFSLLRADETNALCDALGALADYDYNTLVISLSEGAIDEGRLPKKPSALLTRLCEHLTPVRFARITPARLAGWVGKHFEHNGVNAAPALCARVVDYCGTSMFTLAAEVDKISFYVRAHGRAELCEDDITAVAVADTSYDAFAFANALIAGDRPRALGILAVMKQQRIEPTVIMGDVSKSFCEMLSVRRLMDEGAAIPLIAATTKIHEYRVGLYARGVASTDGDALCRIIQMCAEADAAVKLSRGYEAIERLICGI
ncbi:MAG: DNA polymerase III subunit delta [Clostridia bacterium]|nr:DNA polymerase III subunit delta [Clostridia bacterium]